MSTTSIRAALAAGRVITTAELNSYTITRVDDLGDGVLVFHGLDEGEPIRAIQAPASMVLQARGMLPSSMGLDPVAMISRALQALGPA